MMTSSGAREVGRSFLDASLRSIDLCTPRSSSSLPGEKGAARKAWASIVVDCNGAFDSIIPTIDDDVLETFAHIRQLVIDVLFLDRSATSGHLREALAPRGAQR